MATDLDLLIGKWTVKVKAWTWEYEFQRDGPVKGRVSWRDLNSFEKGSGNWVASSKLVNISWNGSKTHESWQRPLTTSNDKTWYESSYFRGKYRIEKAGATPGPTPPPPTPPSPTPPPPAPKPTDRAWKFSLKLQADTGSIFSFKLELTDPDGKSQEFLTARPKKFENTFGTQVNCIQVGTLSFPKEASLDGILGCLAAVALKPGDRAAVLTGILAVSSVDNKINSSAPVTGAAQGQPKEGGTFFVAAQLERMAL